MDKIPVCLAPFVKNNVSICTKLPSCVSYCNKYLISSHHANLQDELA